MTAFAPHASPLPAPGGADRDLPSPWWSPARAALQAQARRFAIDEVLPVARVLDPQRAEMPRHLVDRMGELGLFGILVDREHGGRGLGVFEYCMVSEELARAWMSVAGILARGQGLGCDVADASERAALLRRSAEGQWIGAVAFSEPSAGSDLAAVSTRAERDGAQWVIRGRKRWCGNALAADFIEVLCRFRDPVAGESRAAGLGTLLVRKPRGAFPAGLSGSPIDKVGYHGFITWDLQFDGVRVPVGDVLRAPDGADTSGFAAVQRQLNIARVQTAARAVGLARAAVEDTAAYLRERHQFGHPIGDFQALRFKLADMTAAVEQARAHYRQVAHLMDVGEASVRDAAAVKLMATEMAVTVTNEAMQLHGGNGYTSERDVERHWRDARLTTIFEGTSEIQRRVISDATLGRSG